MKNGKPTGKLFTVEKSKEIYFKKSDKKVIHRSTVRFLFEAWIYLLAPTVFYLSFHNVLHVRFVKFTSTTPIRTA